ncbi:MAG: 16S rRNA (uracil(1498)-N(3))-methyltransferase [Bacteroidota bacterium]|nr:16S rRNA (uracil(1498)-N(3))-methyltransferase [Bacteroidota bacterium]
MHIFHTPDLEGEIIVLPDEEAHHAMAVLRSRTGDRIGLVNGKGTTADAEIIQIDKKICEVRVLERKVHPPERFSKIHLAVAVTKQIDRFEWFLEKAVELGVDRITPLFTERSERNKVRLDRLEKVMIAAMKQSKRAWLPVLDEAIHLKELLKWDLPAQRYFGWCEGEHQQLMNRYTMASDAIVLVGPEGDLSSSEAAQLMEQKMEPVAIGEARLRTETAALAACTWMSLLQQK